MSTPSTSAPSLAAGNAVVPSPHPRSSTLSPLVTPSPLTSASPLSRMRLGDAREVALFPECLVRIHRSDPDVSAISAISNRPALLSRLARLGDR